MKKAMAAGGRKRAVLVCALVMVGVGLWLGWGAWGRQPRWVRDAVVSTGLLRLVPPDAWSLYLRDPDLSRIGRILDLMERDGIPDAAAPEVLRLVRGEAGVGLQWAALETVGSAVVDRNPAWAHTLPLGRVLTDLAVQTEDQQIQEAAALDLSAVSHLRPPVLGPEDLRRIAPLVRSSDRAVSGDIEEALKNATH